MRIVLGTVLALVLASALIAQLGVTGTFGIGREQVVGAAVPDLDGLPGQETGPTCPVDKRYSSEDPKGLRPDVLEAWRRAVAEAQKQGVTLCLQDGKRSTRQQQAQFDDYVRRYGTPELARNYVLPPEQSMHVKGIAADVQPLSAAAWLEGTRGALGWCRRYDNEPWHFEYDPAYPTAGCPALLPHA